VNNPVTHQVNMMNTPKLALGIALFSALGFIAANTQAAEAGATTSGAGTAAHNVAEGANDRIKERQLAEGGADRLQERRLAEGGADRLKERQLASDGSDRLKQNNVAAGYNSMRGTRVAEGGSDRLRQNHYADGSNGYDASSDVMPYFCMECR
jgi:hypothetical protein